MLSINTNNLLGDVYEDIFLCNILAEVLTFICVPYDQELHLEALEKFKLKYSREIRPTLVNYIKQGFLHPSILSNVRSWASLPDEHYIHENNFNEKKTYLQYLDLQKKQEPDYLRVCFLLLELLFSQPKNKASLDRFQHSGLLKSYKKGSDLLKSLGAFTKYEKTLKKYRKASHYILSLNCFDARNEEFNGYTFLKYCNYFKDKLLALHNPHSSTNYLFKESDLHFLEKNTWRFSPEEIVIVESELIKTWSILRKKLLNPQLNELLLSK